MKVLTVILGILCLLISAYPCCIVDECDSHSIAEIAENEQEQEECGLCSPFITCGSCIGFIPNTAEFVTTLNPQLLPFSNLFGLSFKSVEAEYADRVWQPPQQVIFS